MNKYLNRENLRVMLRSARRNAGLTQEQLAAKLKTSQESICRAERHGVDTINFAERWVNACGYYLRFNHISYGDEHFSRSSFTDEK